MKHAGSLRIFDVAFALEATGIAPNREFDVVFGLDRKVETIEGFLVPIGLMVTRMFFRMLKESKADLARLFGRLDGPASVTRICFRREEREGANESDGRRNYPCYEFFRTHDNSS